MLDEMKKKDMAAWTCDDRGLFFVDRYGGPLRAGNRPVWEKAQRWHFEVRTESTVGMTIGRGGRERLPGVPGYKAIRSNEMYRSLVDNSPGLISLTR